jgi:hypothetical protein
LLRRLREGNAEQFPELPVVIKTIYYYVVKRLMEFLGKIALANQTNICLILISVARFWDKEYHPVNQKVMVSCIGHPKLVVLKNRKT